MIVGISTNVGGVKDIMIDGVTGLLSNPGDPRDLALKMKLAVDNPTKWRQMGEAGRNFVNQNFSYSAMISSFEQLYRGLISQHGLAIPSSAKEYKPLVSIITVVHNRRDTITDTIKSIDT